ncbi:UDP-galactose/UDP-glucose transporter 3 [Cinnamomum micranthum f. kanehirae]|uniref:UDP-galactose/UDP-glucose transporter 3 n=1 Tax=Cinnamomum micranthum f. kanehirae TaxID=337451 RepID=A0A443NCC5_9MAGN|nr:UDP-galactose/UDP-glucose transporter 3 [Cinnamomum micranthum f. kanehirae]
MLMGTLAYGIKYTFPEYVCTFLVAGGVLAFALLKTSSKTIRKLAHLNAPLGYGSCFLNLALDGFTNATQDSISLRDIIYDARILRNGHHIQFGLHVCLAAWGVVLRPHARSMWDSGVSQSTPLKGVRQTTSMWDSGVSQVQFCKQHQEVPWDIFLYCLCGAVGQNFIFLTISRFGSLANTTITTTRKFVSIVVSSLLSGNPLSSKQWGCVFMVFSGLSYQIYLKWRKLQEKKKST